MPQYPRSYRPVRNLQSLDRLEGLAGQFADLTFRNDVETQRQRQEVERRARAMQLRQGLSDVAQEPDYLRRNLMRSDIGFGLQDLGYKVDSRMLGFEDAPKVTEKAPPRLVSKPTGNTKTEKGLQFEEYVDVDPTTPFDQSKLSSDTPRYWKPAGNVPKDTGSDQTVKDLEEYRTRYNEADATVKQLEDVYGKDELDKWTQDKVVQKGVVTYGDDAASLLAALTAGDITTEEKQRIQATAQYMKALAARGGQEKNLEGKGHYVDESGKLVKGKRPAKKLMTQDEFVSDFMGDVGRKPTENEIAKAKGKYWQ